MKNLIRSAAIVILLVSCGKHNDSNKLKVIIKGTISTNPVKSSRLKSGNSLSLSDAKKVLVFNSSGSYLVFPLSGSSFEAMVASGTAVAVSFLDANNNFIGCLHAGGLNVLPLVSLKDGDNTIIDLSTLTLDSTNVIPANNPLGNEIGLQANEIQWYKELGAYYESLSKNIDIDNDGIPDMLVKKHVLISTHYSVSIGKWGLNDIQPQINDTSTFSIVYQIRVSGGKAITPSSSNVVLSGPEEEPYTDILPGTYTPAPDGFISFFARHSNSGEQSLPFKKGIYTLTLDEKNYKLNYSNVCPKHFLIIPEPTLHTNANNEVVSVSIDYKLPDHSNVIAENFVYLVQLHIIGQNMTMLYEVGGLFTSPDTNPNVEKYNFTLPTPIPLSKITNVGVNYQDLLGNEYDTGWSNE